MDRQLVAAPGGTGRWWVGPTSSPGMSGAGDRERRLTGHTGRSPIKGAVGSRHLRSSARLAEGTQSD